MPRRTPDLDEESEQGVEEPVVAPEEATPAREEELTPPPLPASFSFSPDDAVVGPSTMIPQDDFSAHQELLKQVALNLGLEADELKEPADELFDILEVAAPSKVILPVHEGVMQLVKAFWQTLSSLAPTCKQVEKK